MLKNKENLIPKLIFLLFITTIIATTVTLSSYESIANGNTDIEVAAFVVDATGDKSNTLEINCNSENRSATYDIIVTNEKNNCISEVGIEYDLKVVFSPALPEGMNLTLTAGDYTKTYTGGEKTYTFENIGQFTAGTSQSITNTLTLTGSENTAYGVDGYIKFYLEAYQID